jgi:hypothetical protein
MPAASKDARLQRGNNIISQAGMSFSPISHSFSHIPQTYYCSENDNAKFETPKKGTSIAKNSLILSPKNHSDVSKVSSFLLALCLFL